VHDRPLFLLPEGLALDLPAAVLRGGEVRRYDDLPAATALDPDRPTVLVLAVSGAESLAPIGRGLDALAAAAALVGVGRADHEAPSDAVAEQLCAFIPAGSPPSLVRVAVGGALRHALQLVLARRARASARARQDELAELTRIGAALTTERDLQALLAMILAQARRVSTADAGSLYLVDRAEHDGPPTTLRFKLAQNDTLPDLRLEEFVVPVDRASVAGYVAATGEPLTIADVRDLPAGAEYQFNRRFDETFGYRTRSMLVVPMKTQRGEVIGVLQLLNRKRDASARLADDAAVEAQVTTFSPRVTLLVTALASQAAVAVENARLYEDIERLLEGFVTAAVTAIEQRDPATSGHSGRVATMTVGIAEAINRGGAPAPYRGLAFSRDEMRELRYASLLHDFGKVGVRELVLVKEKKLYPWDLERIRMRFGYLATQADRDFERERAEYVLAHGPEAWGARAAEWEARREARRRALFDTLDQIVRANEPTILAEGDFSALASLRERTYTDFDGAERPLLTDDELRFLLVRKGTLAEDERREIESHVTHSYNFLEQIPWTRELKGVPLIAYGHHEKLNGKGYPRGLAGHDIPVQTRMMTISDIYDALTATDRPYKRAVPETRALDILHMEAREGMVDPHLLQVFVEAGVHRATVSAGVKPTA
jgi:HD-GYP domain-containing protein (c-di-GMP phosphodiesterase class II)